MFFSPVLLFNPCIFFVSYVKTLWIMGKEMRCFSLVTFLILEVGYTVEC